MNISQNGIDFIKSFEGFYPNAYDDLQPKVKITSMSQVKGTLTIGYGSTGNNVKVGQVITKEQAEMMLLNELKTFENDVNKLVKVDISQSQFDALVSFDYNTGALGKSTLLKYVNQKEFIKASLEFEKWVHSKGILLDGLVKRRKAEKELFLKEVTKPIGQPSPEQVKNAITKQTTHIVKPGDNLTKIAAKYGTTVTAIQKLNIISNPDLIIAGKTLKIK